VFAFDWPLGSNGLTAVSAINADADNSQGNVLTNSSFDEITSNVPDQWELTSGAAGVNIFQETTIVYQEPPNKAIRILGNGVTVQLRQIFDDGENGTSGQLDPQTQYSFNVFLRRDGVAPGAGTLTFDLVDENGVVIKDMNVVDNSFSVTLSGLSTVYTSYTGVFRTPAIMPEEAYIRITCASLTAGRSIYLDFASMGVMTQVYVSGPFVAVHAGSVPFLAGDYGTCQITNSRGAAGTLSTWQVLFFQLFGDMYTSELMLPSSSTPNVADSLIG
jgi:hypothetical protein